MRTRREFLLNGSIALAGFALVPASSIGGPAGSEPKLRSLDQISYAALAAQTGTAFLVRLAASASVKLRLLEAPLAAPAAALESPPPADARYERFSLIFAGPSGRPIPCGLHWLAHEGLGEFEMCINRVGSSDTRSLRYEAVFNRPPVPDRLPSQTI